MTQEDIIKKHENDPEFASMSVNQKLWVLNYAGEYANLVKAESISSDSKDNIYRFLRIMYDLGYRDREIEETLSTPRFTDDEIAIRIRREIENDLTN